MKTIKSIKTIDIQGREWFDKTDGNSYFSARVTVNYGMKDAITFFIEFEYGYGDSYIYAAIKILQRCFRNIPNSLWDMQQKGIIVRTSKQSDLKRNVIAYGNGKN